MVGKEMKGAEEKEGGWSLARKAEKIKDVQGTQNKTTMLKDAGERRTHRETGRDEMKPSSFKWLKQEVREARRC